MSKLEDVLSKIEDADDKNLILSTLNAKDTKINDLSTQVRSQEKEVKEVSAAKKTIEALTSEAESLRTKIKTYEKRDAVTNFSKVANTNSEVLMDLLPEDIELVVDKVGEGDDAVDAAFVMVDGKRVEFGAYVDNDPRLKLYKPSIFTPVEAAPVAIAAKTTTIPVTMQTTVALPKGADAANKDSKILSGDFFSQNYNPVLDRIKDALK